MTATLSGGRTENSDYMIRKNASATPDVPSSGYRQLYPKSDGWYEQDEAGNNDKLVTENELAAAHVALADEATHATTADALVGADSAGSSSYFGSNSTGSMGFYSLPIANGPNLLINGGFDLCQRRGSSINPPGIIVANDTYCFDGWYALTETGNVYIIRGAGATKSIGSAYYGEMHTPFTAQCAGIAQIIPYVLCQQTIGKTVILCVQLGSSSAGNVTIPLLLGVGVSGTADVVTSDFITTWTTAGAFNPEGGITADAIIRPNEYDSGFIDIGSTAQYVLSFTMPDYTVGGSVPYQNLILFLPFGSASAGGQLALDTYVTFACADLYIGTAGRTWAPRTMSEEIILAQRRYYKNIDLETDPQTNNTAPHLYIGAATVANNVAYNTTFFPTTMMKVPTITTRPYGTAANTGRSSPSVSSDFGASSAVGYGANQHMTSIINQSGGTINTPALAVRMTIEADADL